MDSPRGNVYQTGWAFTGFCEEGRGSKRHEVSVPIGVYSTYALGAESADAWMKSVPAPLRWEGDKLYEELEDAK